MDYVVHKDSGLLHQAGCGFVKNRPEAYLAVPQVVVEGLAKRLSPDWRLTDQVGAKWPHWSQEWKRGLLGFHLCLRDLGPM